MIGTIRSGWVPPAPFVRPPARRPKASPGHVFRRVEVPARPGLRITAEALGETVDTAGGAFAAEDARRRAWLDEQLRKGTR